MTTQEVRVRLAPQLRMFVAPRHRREEVPVGHDGTATVGHLVESLGVPLPEVGELLADGAPVAARHRPQDGALLEVRPVERPQPISAPPRFLLDVHFGARSHGGSGCSGSTPRTATTPPTTS